MTQAAVCCPALLGRLASTNSSSKAFKTYVAPGPMDARRTTTGKIPGRPRAPSFGGGSRAIAARAPLLAGLRPRPPWQSKDCRKPLRAKLSAGRAPRCCYGFQILAERFKEKRPGKAMSQQKSPRQICSDWSSDPLASRALSSHPEARHK